MNVLSIQNLSVSFTTDGGELQALRNVSFDVPERRIVGIVGESGCGKSTLISAILGLLADNGQIQRGSILFEGEAINERSEQGMRELLGQRISTVFQDPMGTLNPVLSIGRQMLNIQYRLADSKRDKIARCIDSLEQVRIPDPQAALKRYPHEFSGGMKQRIAIAMALMMKPALLIADEPTTALDATLEVAIIELLQQLQQQIGCAVMFVSHHLGVIAELCDDVVVMYAGEVVEHGSVRQIFNHPQHPYTARLLECDPARHSTAAIDSASQRQNTLRLPTIAGEIPDLRQPTRGCIFAPRCDRRQLACDSTPPVIEVATGHIARCIDAGNS
jgi:oligopeptide/dipeptide ABC transporter ATP-binding protein